MKPVSIIEFPFNLGLKAQAGREPGVHKLPAWLKQHGFHDRIAATMIDDLPAPPYRMDMEPGQPVLNTGHIVAYAQLQGPLIHKALAAGSFPLVIGGDCSISLGITLALKKLGKFALFYLDGHTDFMGHELSGTKAAGGMVAAMAAGQGPDMLVNIDHEKPYIQEEHVCCVGNREYDEAYEDAIRFSKATYVSLAMLRGKGIVPVITSFLDMVNREELDGFWLHIDVDVLADELMPAVDSRTAGGLVYEEFNELLGLLLASPKIAGLGITILDPGLDSTGKYTKDFVHHFTNTFNAAMQK